MNTRVPIKKLSQTAPHALPMEIQCCLRPVIRKNALNKIYDKTKFIHPLMNTDIQDNAITLVSFFNLSTYTHNTSTASLPCYQVPINTCQVLDVYILTTFMLTIVKNLILWQPQGSSLIQAVGVGKRWQVKQSFMCPKLYIFISHIGCSH